MEEPTNALARIAPGNFPLTPEQSKELTIAANLSQKDSFLWAEELPGPLKNDREFKMLFSTYEGETWSTGYCSDPLGLASSTMKPEEAFTRIVRLCRRYGLDAGTTVKIARAWFFAFKKTTHGAAAGEFPNATIIDLIRTELEQAGPARNIAALVVAPAATPADVLSVVSQALRIQVIGFTKYGVDRPEFCLVLAGGEVVKLGRAKDLLNQHHVRCVLFNVTGIAFPEFSKSEWFALTTKLGSVCTSMGSPLDVRRENLFRSLRDYLASRLSRDVEAARREGQSFVEDGVLYIRSGDVTGGSNLGELGFESTAVDIGKTTGKRKIIRYMAAKVAALPHEVKDALGCCADEAQP